LADEGVKQITLLGQTVNSYEYKAGDETYCLADLLDFASRINGIEWIRFVTSYPTERFFEPIINAMAKLPKVCSHLHIPAQSGSDKILKKMNRKYTADEYLALIDKARSIVPDIAIASDFIVGFPGESDEDFQQTINLIKEAGFKNSYIFKYSPRPGTIGDKKLKDNVPQAVKKQRNIELLAVQEKISAELAEKCLGKTVKVLVEGPSKKPHLNSAERENRPQLVGRTEHDWIVVFNGPKSLAGEFVEVQVEKTSPLTLFGQLNNYSNRCLPEINNQ
jgi:tRNA-2-methylthio-N6-dimethylallyladenosine synthase